MAEVLANITFHPHFSFCPILLGSFLPFASCTFHTLTEEHSLTRLCKLPELLLDWAWMLGLRKLDFPRHVPFVWLQTTPCHMFPASDFPNSWASFLAPGCITCPSDQITYSSCFGKQKGKASTDNLNRREKAGCKGWTAWAQHSRNSQMN